MFFCRLTSVIPARLAAGVVEADEGGNPGFDNHMEILNSSEKIILQPDQSETVPDQKTPGIDVKLRTEISKFFNALVEDSPADDELQMFYQEQEKDLLKLTIPEKLEKIKPNEMAQAFSAIAGVVSNSKLSLESFRQASKATDAEDSKLIKELEDLHQSSKDIFFKSGAKLYPETNGDIRQWGEITHALGLLFPETNRLVEHFKELKDKPEQLLKELETFLTHYGSSIGDRAQDIFSAEINGADKQLIAEKNKNLASAAWAIYKLYLMRNKLQKQIHGKEDASAEDTKKIDLIREKIGSTASQSDSPISRGKQEEAGSEGIGISSRGGLMKKFLEAKNLSEIEAAWTPEIKSAFRANILKEVDKTIEDAKRICAKEPNMILGRWSLASVIGQEAQSGLYQRAYLVETKNMREPANIAALSIAKFLLDVFNYDLAKDSERAQSLEMYTNMLWSDPKRK